ncbi:MAG: MCP four helix bundle domain-containing protein [Clostridium sp.]|uniref:HAMP domain-containing sensor histidine kinase n=1 Tax=Clostridium sp. TaxID=1506 RepID=UPI0025B99BB4|nr:ATP-binding protein [Clostridium sp.]MCE5220867.1 MCP four helix bundle domain-containing protein [Clostridium sp.]
MIKSIKSKISLILIVFILLTIGNSFVSINFFNKLQKSIDSIMHANYDSVVYAQNMNNSLERQDSLELSFIFENNLELLPEYELNHTNFLEWLGKAKNNITEEGEQETIDLIEKNYTDYTTNVEILISIKKNQGGNEASKYYYSNVFPKFKDVKENCNTLLDINQKSMINMKEKSKELVTTAKKFTLGIAGVALIIGISIISYLLRKIIHPIEDLAIGINKVSEGNYEYTIPLRREKEINFIFDCFNNMVEKLKEYDRLNVNKILREKQRTEAIIESIKSPIIVTDDKNKIIMLNQSAERLFDVKEKKVINRKFLDGIKEKKIFDMIQEARNSIEDYKAFEDIELGNNQHKDYYRITISPIWFTDIENLGAVTIMQDITKFKELDEMKTDFISNVSHEFRTPLTSICMAVGLLRDRNVDINDDEMELLTIIKEDSDKLDNLVGELLDLSKMKSGKIEMEIRDIDINEVISQIKRAFKIQIEEKNVTLNIDTNRIVKKVKADINRISWVIANLLGNALRYIKTDGTGIIEIKAREVNNTMLVSICDNGEGIAEEYQELIFEKFMQIKDKNGETTGSSGLGLAICKEIVKAHGEEIWVDSTVGEGSLFYFTLKSGEAL